MGNIFEILQWVAVFFAGSLVPTITSIALFRSNKKIKEIEAKSVEFKMLESQIVFLGQRLDILYKELGKSEEARAQYRKELNISEIKRHKNKNAILQAYSCQYVSECPVLHRVKELEEEWELESNKSEIKKEEDGKDN